jgi:hypothetical protein
MKMSLNKSISILSFLFMSVLIFSCAEDGEIGPVGPQGTAGTNGTDGADGATGPQGADGQDGEDGNANVIYSDWFSPVWNIADGSNVKTMEIVDQEFVAAQENGVILLYWATQDESTHLLPWNTFNSLGTISISRDYEIKGSSGKVELTIRNYELLGSLSDEDTEGTISGVTYNQLRYVIIPGSTSNSFGRIAAEVDYEDYEAVKAYYNIPD